MSRFPAVQRHSRVRRSRAVMRTTTAAVFPFRVEACRLPAHHSRGMKRIRAAEFPLQAEASRWTTLSSPGILPLTAVRSTHRHISLSARA